MYGPRFKRGHPAQAVSDCSSVEWRGRRKTPLRAQDVSTLAAVATELDTDDRETRIGRRYGSSPEPSCSRNRSAILPRGGRRARCGGLCDGYGGRDGRTRDRSLGRRGGGDDVRGVGRARVPVAALARGVRPVLFGGRTSARGDRSRRRRPGTRLERRRRLRGRPPHALGRRFRAGDRSVDTAAGGRRRHRHLDRTGSRRTRSVRRRDRGGHRRGTRRSRVTVPVRSERVGSPTSSSATAASSGNGRCASYSSVMDGTPSGPSRRRDQTATYGQVLATLRRRCLGTPVRSLERADWPSYPAAANVSFCWRYAGATEVVLLYRVKR